MKHLSTLFFLILLIGLNPVITSGQVSGGKGVFTFLEMPASARLTALGGYLVSVKDEDVNLALGNPALVNESGHQRISFSHNFHLAGTGQGYFSYGNHSKKLNTTFHGGIQYMQYGDIPLTNEFSQVLGTFSPSDLAVTVGASRRYLDRIQYGLNIRYMQSMWETYKSTGLALDAGVYYENPEDRFSIGMVLQNIGGQMTRFNPDAPREAIPFNALIGFSKRLRFLPFRYSITAHTLHQWDVRYDDPDLRQDVLFPGQDNEEDSRFSQGVENIFRHLIFSGEFLLGKSQNFRIRFAYDHRMRRELRVPNFGGMAGFSGGLGLKIYRFHIDYGFGGYHLAGATHHLSIGTPLTAFFPGI